MRTIKFKTGEDYYNRIHFIFNAIIAVSLLPFSLIFLNIQKEGNQNAYLDTFLGSILNVVVVALSSFFVYKSFESYKEFKKKLDSSDSLRKKLTDHYWVFVRHNLILGGIGLIVTLNLFLTKSPFLIVGYIILLVLLSINRPTLKNIIQKLRLSKEEQEILFQKLNID